jgi:hypothetical protein
VAGDRNPDDDLHLHECSQCTAEANRLEALLAAFRSHVHAWHALQKSAAAPGQWERLQRRSRFAIGALRWKVALAVLAIAVAVPICKNTNERQRETIQSRADAQLWEEVNIQVARPVPTPLEPLMKLIIWEPGTEQ